MSDALQPGSGWLDAWRVSFGAEPPKPSSSEESIATQLDRLLSGRPHVGYGYRYKPVEAAAKGFARLRSAAFQLPELSEPPEVVTEGTFPIPDHLRIDRRKGLSPDWVLSWPTAITIVEFKTVAGSMGLQQIQRQLDVFRWNHPAVPLEHLYVTPVPALFKPVLDDAMAYRNISWSEFVAPLLGAFSDEPTAVAIRSFVEIADQHRWWT